LQLVVADFPSGGRPSSRLKLAALSIWSLSTTVSSVPELWAELQEGRRVLFAGARPSNRQPHRPPFGLSREEAAPVLTAGRSARWQVLPDAVRVPARWERRLFSLRELDAVPPSRGTPLGALSLLLLAHGPRLSIGQKSEQALYVTDTSGRLAVINLRRSGDDFPSWIAGGQFLTVLSPPGRFILTADLFFVGRGDGAFLMLEATELSTLSCTASDVSRLRLWAEASDELLQALRDQIQERHGQDYKVESAMGTDQF